jgi:ABC-2 type transport system permease protein
MAVLNFDRSPASADFLDRFFRSGYFARVSDASSYAELERALDSGRARLGLVIPPEFGRRIPAGESVKVQVVVDGTDNNTASIALGYFGSVAQSYSVEMLLDRMRRTSYPLEFEIPALDLVPRVWYNPDLKSRWFYVPAVLAMVLILVTLMLPSMAVVREKEIGTLEQISVTPLRPWQLMVGKLVPFAIIGMLDLLLIVGVARVVFGVPLRGSLLLLMLLTLLYLLNTLSLGLLVSTLVRTQQQAMMFSAFVLMVPMIYLSGLIFPIENMPTAFQLVSYAIAVRYYGNILRGIFLRGSGLAVLAPDALALLAGGLLVLTLASLRFRKSLD